MTKNLQVLVLAKGLPPERGGVESYSHEVINELLNQGCQVTVISPTRDYRLQHSRLTVIALSGNTQAQCFLGLLRLCIGSFQFSRYDFILATTWRMAFPLVFSAVKAPVLVTVHGNEFLKAGVSKIFANLVFKLRCKAVLAVSNYTKQMFIHRFPHVKAPVYLAYNGVALAAESPVARVDINRLRLFTVCRHEDRKNISFCIDVVDSAKKLLAGSSLSLEYLVAGSGPLTSALIDKVKDLGLEKNVRFLGKVGDDELDKLYESSDVFLHPQLERLSSGDIEGFGLVVADAMSRGLVVFAGDNGGPKELIEDNVSGLLVDPQNVPLCASRLVSLALDSSRLREISESASAKMRNKFSWDKHVATILNAFGEIV